MGFNFANPRIPLGSWIETFFDWFQNAFDWLITFTNVVIGACTTVSIWCCPNRYT